MIVYSSSIVKGTDIDGNSQNVGVAGAAQDELKTSDLYQQDVLTNVVKELKIMNTHLALITDISVEREDVEV